MNSLDHIPHHLRYTREKDDWSPRRALMSGSAWTAFVGVVFAVLAGTLAYGQPAFDAHWAACAVVLFLVTAILHAVMNSISTMVTEVGNRVAIGMGAFVVIATYFARLAGLSAATFPSTSLWGLFSIGEFVLGNGTAWLGILVAAYICKDGDDILEHIGVYWLCHILMARRG